MSPHSRTSDESQESELAGQSDLAAAYMSNTSTYPLLRDGYDSAKLMEEHPSFAEHVWPHAMETILYPGDLLVMPPGWWHAMRGEGKGPGWSISMWY
jgi:lysine-specific demethylase 8